MQYDICHPYILTEMKGRIIFQNGFQTGNYFQFERAIPRKHTSDIIKHHIFL